jgi:uncharacterized membrane protein YsdA (DUF1294 family)
VPIEQLLYVLVAYAVMSPLTFLAFGYDKHQARQDGWRISERTLHGMEMLGGWPGALLGRKAFRHKTRKRSYTRALYGIIAVHALFWAWVVLQALGLTV